jgi:hypothetical protein
MLRRSLLSVVLALVATAVAAAYASARVAPVAALSGPAAMKAGSKATFDASSSTHDPAGKIVEYAWDLDGSGHFDDVRKTPTITAVMDKPGPVKIAVRVTDDVGATSIAVGNFLVEDPPPATTGEPAPDEASAPPPGAPSAGSDPLGGDPAHGVAPLDPAAQQWISVGSARRFAAINGAARRRLGAVRARGLWVNLLSDRPARFALGVYVTRPDARRLGLRGRRVGGRVAVGYVTTRLRAAGQRPHRIVLPRKVRRALRAPVTLLVIGTATDAKGGRASLSRAFALRSGG